MVVVVVKAYVNAVIDANETVVGVLHVRQHNRAMNGNWRCWNRHGSEPDTVRYTGGTVAVR